MIENLIQIQPPMIQALESAVCRFYISKQYSNHGQFDDGYDFYTKYSTASEKNIVDKFLTDNGYQLQPLDATNAYADTDLLQAIYSKTEKGIVITIELVDNLDIRHLMQQIILDNYKDEVDEYTNPRTHRFSVLNLVYKSLVASGNIKKLKKTLPS